ncbi:type II secretion system F family protein [Alphaproteobacteria bacterium]|nr:type II secretion system F family protein [Alphaproteobacteria bacterium]
MKKFTYKGKQRGKKVKGELEIGSIVSAKQKLRSDGIREITIKEIKPKKKSALDIQITWGPFGSIPPKEIMVFTKKIATMMRAGLPIVEAMVLVAAQSTNPNMKRVATEMIDKLNNGASLSASFREHKRHFDSVYLNMVEAGEISGKLDVFLDRLVEMLEKQQAIKAGIKSALFYPVTLVVITVSISYFMLTNVVPTFQEMYEGLGAELPGPTQSIVDASNWIQDGGNVMNVIGTVTAIWLTNKTLHRFVRPYRKMKSIIALKLPLIGDIIVKATVARMSLLMANLLAAGVSVIDTLEVSSTVSQNVQFLDAMTRIKQKITTGAPLSQLFGNEKVFPLALSQLMAVGERTGNMDEMLTSIAKYYEEEFTAVVDGLSTIIEPLMIVFVGAMIGVMVVALYLPIFSAGDAIR